MGRVNTGESISVAFISLWANKLRTFLTLLGIIIGVFSVIAIVSIIQGLNNYVKYKMFQYGTNSFSVSKMPSIITSDEKWRKFQKRKDLTMQDLRLIREKCESCGLVGAFQFSVINPKYKNNLLKEAWLYAVTHVDYLIGRSVDLQIGRHFTQEEEEHSRYTCVIGHDIKEKLFPFTDPIGKKLKIWNHHFRIVGVGKKEGKMLGFSMDNWVRIPITTFHRVRGKRRSIQINVKTSSPETLQKAQEEVRLLLRTKRHILFNKPDDFAIETSETFIDTYKKLTSGIFAATIIIAAISLLVGGIVIMNIMLVAVTERTKEIGIRKAVGARRKDILVQFLIEASVISGVGGIVGILLGFIIARIITAATTLPSSVEPWSIVIAILVSTSIGLFFGLYPANKAAKLDPIESLRSEQ